MSAGRALFFLTCFFIEVRVKAEALVADGQRKVVSESAFTLVLARGTLVDRRSSEYLQLVRGLVYFDGAGSRVVATPYAQMTCPHGCKVLVEREADRMHVRVLSGEAKLIRKGDAREYAVPAGYQVQIGEVTASGHADMEFPQSLPWEKTVKTWAGLYPGRDEEFKATLVKFRPAWKEAVEHASRLHAEEAGRRIASHEQDLVRARARKAAEERENEDIRRRFREKNYIYP